jgi:hypothetical protein
MPSDDEELLERFSRRLAEIESEIPETSLRKAGSVARVGRRRSAFPGWIGASLVAAVLVGLAVMGLRLWGLPGPTPSAPAVGQTAAPSSIAQAPSPDESLTPTSPSSPDSSAQPSTTPKPTNGPPVTPAPTPPPTTFPSVPTETPTAAPNVWIGPERIATEYYLEVSLAVDGDGFAHVAGTALRDGAFYLTNASGSWTRERLTTAPPEGYDGQPSIVIRDDGSLAIAFTRFTDLQCSFGCVPVDPQGIFLITNRSGTWSDSVRIIDGTAQEPSLQATDGGLDVAYSRGGGRDRTIEYAHAADEFDSWTITAVGEGQSPSLRIGADGLARVAYYLSPFGVRSLFYAAQTDSTEFVTERVPGEWRSDTTGSPPLLALDASDEPQIVFFNETESEPRCALSVRRTAGTWSDASIVFPEDEFCQLEAAGIATDGGGTLHVISDYNLTNMGVWYANEAGGEFRAERLRGLGGRSISDVPDGDSAIAVDGGGRPHILYVVLYSERRDDDGLWYGIGPAVER